MNRNTSINNQLREKELLFNVNYPILKNATYKSLVNYSSDLNKKIQRWYRYKEGYSITLVENILDNYKVTKEDIVLDPFVGSGSTIIEAKKRGCHAIGYEVNPFSYFLCKTKTQNYSKKDKDDFIKIINEVVNSYTKYKKFNEPKLSTTAKLFKKDILDYLLKIKTLLTEMNVTEKSRDLAKLVWLGILEEVSNYRKAGNGLKKRNTKKENELTLPLVKQIILTKLNQILEDLDFAIEISKTSLKEPRIIMASSLSMPQLKNNTIKGVIFSPPYANCFDYTEIYKMELWFGDFVLEYPDLKKLRSVAVRSHLNGYKNCTESKIKTLKYLEDILLELSKQQLWDKRIPEMIRAYFQDMFTSLEEIYRVLKKDGFCSIIVSNSAYAGIVIPTDLLLAEYAKNCGFKVKKIDVARFIIPSSQQYTKTRSYKNFLRESIIFLEK
ncbi:DNA adenine methylase [Patescibacteria group bacterium]|nr:DNA adenine methylase [Patescibacteria group bacterium]MBU2081366.1 DNA adenine methylase [Patescibacteria group bacterium]MBU2250243.1 DNA adenine methylase [Patescibacteria group bacterium]